MSAERTILFDLSEVLVSGLCGIESKLAPILHLPQRPILNAFCDESLRALCRGDIDEQHYLAGMVRQQGWALTVEELKKHIRANFHWKIAGMRELVHELAGSYRLGLYADHGREWAEYILAIHPFLNLFSRKLFSFELGLTKGDAGAFPRALAHFGCAPEQCLFIDDNPAHVAAARAAGICAVQFSSARVLRMALASQGVRVPV